MRHLLWIPLWCLLGVSSSAQSPPDADEQAWLKAARQASGFESLPPDSVLELDGASELLGVPTRARTVFAKDGRFRRLNEGSLHRESVFDGHAVHLREFGVGPYLAELSNREGELLRSWVHSGYWLSPHAPLSRKRNDGHISVRLDDGLTEVRVELDSEDHLPRALVIPDGSSELRIHFDDYRLVHGLRLAHEVRGDFAHGHSYVHKVETVSSSTIASTHFDPPEASEDSFLDPDQPPTVEVRLSRSKHLYVRPKVNGVDIGFFLFDTGAGFSGITPRAAEQLGLERLGSTAVTGLGGGSTTTSMRLCDTFELGPLTIDELLLTEIERKSTIDPNLGAVVNGVLGWDILSRCLVELCPDGSLMTLRDFEEATDLDIPWEPIVLHYKVPWIKARFTGDRDGLFMVDTGAAGIPVYFFSAATRRLGLLEGVPIDKNERVGAGGHFGTTLANLEHFEIFGDTFKNDPTVFGLGDDGEDDPYTVGLVGGGLLRLYRMVIDYSRRRMALLPR